MNKATVLIIDDNLEILEFLEDDLSERFEVFTASSGEDALEILEEHVVQLIISDIMMPGIDGFELCQQIKSNFDLSHIPLILLTAKNTIQSKIQGLQCGADAYIEKPFLLEHLNAQIDSLLQNRKKIKDFFASSPLAHISTMANNKSDAEFLDHLKSEIEKNLTDTGLDVEKLAAIMNMSRTTLYRKIKSISDLSPNELINITRLKRAVELIQEQRLRLKEVAYSVGYNSLNQLGRNFQKQFKMAPSEYIKKLSNH